MCSMSSDDAADGLTMKPHWKGTGLAVKSEKQKRENASWCAIEVYVLLSVADESCHKQEETDLYYSNKAWIE